MIHEGQRSFRSQIAYVSLVMVLIVSALIIVLWNSETAALVFGVLGVIWTALTLRSGVEVTDTGFKVRGLLRTRSLTWEETDAFIVVGFNGTARPVLQPAVEYAAPVPAGSEVVGLSLSAIETDAIAMRVPLLSVVAAVTSHGERFRIHGTASTPLDPEFPTDAAAELNSTLKRNNPDATAC